ncbi:MULTISPECIES: hypothetical protein [Rhodococcus]|nr:MULTISPECIES: hypothetical protein [Rhodococcus]MDV8011903.1 hypothetical protein [Rhodococcus sp. IEGM 1241]
MMQILWCPGNWLSTPPHGTADIVRVSDGFAPTHGARTVIPG